MMYRKATLFGDDEIGVKILREPEPKKQKALGRKVKGFERERWDEWKEAIVEEVCSFVFTTDLLVSCLDCRFAAFFLLFRLCICRWDGM